jgi:hypothetical protein
MRKKDEKEREERKIRKILESELQSDSMWERYCISYEKEREERKIRKKETRK